MIKVLVTGADGFLGSNLLVHLKKRQNVDVYTFTRGETLEQLSKMINGVDVIFHLAGINRPRYTQEFISGNVNLTRLIIEMVEMSEGFSARKPVIVFSSSIQSENNSVYGQSKKESEDYIFSYAKRNDATVYILRLPNVFGKWAKPNYNSVVATFCYNIARDLPIDVNDVDTRLSLVYIDDVINLFLNIMDGEITPPKIKNFVKVSPIYQVTVAELAKQIQLFSDNRKSYTIDRMDNRYIRALYSTYLSYLPPESFSYLLNRHLDQRGVFVEILKSESFGQFSFLTANPGVTRGEHFHHSKSEKFLVIKGEALFRFRHILTGELYEVITSDVEARIIDSVPGWAHSIVNISKHELVIMLWANEIYDPHRADTYHSSI